MKLVVFNKTDNYISSTENYITEVKTDDSPLQAKEARLMMFLSTTCST